MKTRTRIACFAALLSSSILAATSAKADEPAAVPTFNCIGLAWTTPKVEGTPPACSVSYRVAGAAGWHNALDLWRDDRCVAGLPGQYRGSIVNLTPDTEYEIRLSIKDGESSTVKCHTWSEKFPIAKTQYAPAGTSAKTLTITDGGTSDGYVLYTHPADSSSTIDVDNAQDHCVVVNASYVIVRGLNLKGAKKDALLLGPKVKNVVVEDCDISGWGEISPSGFGVDFESAVYGDGADIERIVVQNNRIHDPRSGANSWDEPNPGDGTKHDLLHPAGPQGVSFIDTAGNHVVRYNEITSHTGHYYNDGFGGGSNFSYVGSPNKNSDIYGNHIANCRDDSIESEGANCNVRIWGNYLEHGLTGVAMASVTVGPIYVFRNVCGDMERSPVWDKDPDNLKIESAGFIKNADKAFDPKTKTYIKQGLGRIYVFHNTLLQLPPPAPWKYSQGADVGLGWGGPMRNMWSRNNIFYVRPVKGITIKGANDPQCSHDYDLYNGTFVRCLTPIEEHGIKGVPVFGGDITHGEFFLAENSPGFDAGVIIPNFNDDYSGKAPDMGAQEAGSPPMKFGVRSISH